MESSSLAVALSPLLWQLAMSPAASRTALVGRAWAEPPSYKLRTSRMSNAAPRTVAATRGTNQSLRCLMRTAGAHRVSFLILTTPLWCSTRGAELERCSEAPPWTYYKGLCYLASLRSAQVTGGGSPEPGLWTLTCLGSPESKPSSVTLCTTVVLVPSPCALGATGVRGYSISSEAPCSWWE